MSDHIEVMKGAELRDLPLNRLEIHPEIQRKFQLGRARRILAEFDPSLLTPPTVNEENGRLFVYEGQHRTWAAMQWLGGNLNGQLIKCYVRKGAPHKDLARERLATDSQLKMRPIDRFKMRIKAQEPQALAITAVLAKHGLQLAEGKAVGAVACVGCLDSIASRPMGVKMLERVIGILFKTFGNPSEAYHHHLVAAVGLLVYKFGKSLDDARLCRVLSAGQKGAPGWVAAGSQVSQALGGNAIYGVIECVLRAYNAKGRKNRLFWDRKR